MPQQALYLFNGAFAIEQARNLAARPEISGATNPDERIDRLYVLLFGRGPSDEERETRTAVCRCRRAGRRADRTA